MRSKVWAAVCISLWAVPAVAQTDANALTEGQKRKIHLPYIRAATDCVARGILSTPDALRSARLGQLTDAILGIPKGYCGTEIGRMIAAHDQLYGSGTGQSFFTGPYFTDLPRAVGNRLRPELERMAANEAQAEAARRRELARLEAEKRERVDQAQRAFTLLKDKMYECTNNQLAKLITSSETAEVLATAAMTICQTEVSNAVDAMNSKLRIESPNLNSAALNTEIEATIRKSVVTTAVQFKAAVNTPKPTDAPPASAPPVVNAAVPSQPVVQPSQNPAVAAASPPAVTSCLRTMATAREGKFVNREDLVKAMLELCRPEIEAAARSAFLKDDKITLDKQRDQALGDAMKEARAIVGTAN